MLGMLMPCPALIRAPQPSARGITYLGRDNPTTWNVGEPELNRWLVVAQHGTPPFTTAPSLPSVNGLPATNLITNVQGPPGNVTRIDAIQLPLDTDTITVTGSAIASFFILGAVNDALVRTNSTTTTGDSLTVNHTRGTYGAGMIGICAGSSTSWTPSGVTVYPNSVNPSAAVKWDTVSANSVAYDSNGGSWISMCTWNYSY